MSMLQHTPRYVCKLLQNGITSKMSKGVIDVLEVVEITKHDMRGSLLQQMKVDPFQKVTPVVESSKGVEVGELAKPFVQIPSLGDVDDHRSYCPLTHIGVCQGVHTRFEPLGSPRPIELGKHHLVGFKLVIEGVQAAGLQRQTNLLHVEVCKFLGHELIDVLSLHRLAVVIEGALGTPEHLQVGSILANDHEGIGNRIEQ
ncbi:hypothetical protein SDC9_94336 [bioreactor metagenome]|uniref:Uncharacterized protein n=1 Tax=bioreactor metagenome TaxID=1076179 RepID=A0A645A367_9ZZZZ